MRSLVLLLMLLLLLPSSKGLAQLPGASKAALSSELKVDSLFTRHFASIAKSGLDKPLGREDAFFVQLLGHLSGIKNYFWCYASMGLTRGGLLSYENWYAVHRSQITWDTIRQGFALMNTPMPQLLSDSSNIAQARRDKALENLRIK